MNRLIQTVLGFALCCFTTASGQTPDQIARWDSAQLNSARTVELDKTVALYERLALRYQRVQAMRTNGVPAPVVFCLHYREADNLFTSSLAQGDPLTHRSVHMPRGRIPGKNPPYTWEEAAADALYAPELDHLDTHNWRTVQTAFDAIEGYNGLGYRAHGIASPYLWAGTSIYTRGKFASDGRFDRLAVDRQLGCAAILLRMRTRGSALPF